MGGRRSKARQPALFADFASSGPLAFEHALLRQGVSRVAGVDEVGRGPLAGPVVAAAVILPADCEAAVFKDSKTLTPARREELAARLRAMGAAIGIGVVAEDVIDRINILQASLLAMKEAVAAIEPEPAHLLVDGRHQVPMAISQQTIVKGDARSASIAAASIIAKVTRDRMMADYHERYPVYNFRKNQGYPTAEHRAALRRHGPCPIHRRTFSGVKEFFAAQKTGNVDA